MYADSMGFQSAAHMAGGNHDQRKDLMKRYGLNESDYASEGAISQGRVHGKKSYKELNKELMYRASNDYDSRRAMEAAAMSGDKKAKKFAKKGIKNVSDLIDRNNLMRDFHKDMGNGGSFSSESDYAGVSFGKVKEDRDAQTAGYEQQFASQDALSSLKEDLMNQAKEQATGEKVEYTESDELKAAKERLSSGTYDTSSSMFESAAPAASEPPTTAFRKANESAPAQNDREEATKSYLEQYKKDMVKGGQIGEALSRNLSNAYNTVIGNDI